MRYEFDTPRSTRLAVRIPAGRIELATEGTVRTTVEVAPPDAADDVEVEQRGDDIRIELRHRLGRVGRREYVVRIEGPDGPDVEIETSSADVRARGRLGELEAKASSGDIDVEIVDGQARVRTASGDVSIRLVGGRADVNTASGDVELGSAEGDVSIRTASGDVRVAEALADVSVYTASGDQQIGATVHGSVDLKSASGNLRIGIRRGSRLHVDARSMSGSTVSELELSGIEADGEGPLVELRAVSMSGDIRIVRA